MYNLEGEVSTSMQIRVKMTWKEMHIFLGGGVVLKKDEQNCTQTLGEIRTKRLMGTFHKEICKLMWKHGRAKLKTGKTRNWEKSNLSGSSVPGSYPPRYNVEQGDAHLLKVVFLSFQGVIVTV